MIRFLKRNITTALKLPVAAAWDAVSLGNFGDGSSTMKVVEEHQRQKNKDEVMDLLSDIADLSRDE
jgi:hypothetical protein